MALYTPPDITGGLRDFWDYMRADRPHRWPALGLSIAVAGLIIYFIAREVQPDPPGRTIIYVQSWSVDRSDFAIRRDWLNRALTDNERNRQRRGNYGTMARVIGQDYDESAAEREFDDARATIEQALRDLDRAEEQGLPLPPLPRAKRDAQAAPPPVSGGQ